MYVTSVTPDALLIPINQAKIAGAQRRIYLSTLYFGAKEHELVCNL